MKYVHAIKGTAFAIVPIALIIIFAPEPPAIQGVETTLTVSTFIFAILAGFYLSRSNSRYDEMRGVTAAEDALWLAFYNGSKFYGKAFTNKVRSIIDKYYIISTSLELGHNYIPTAPYFEKAYDALVDLKYKQDGKKENIIDDMVIILLEIEKNRNAAAVIAKERLGFGQWAIMIIITFVIFVTLFYFRVDEPFSIVTTTLFANSLVLVLLVARDLQNFRLGGKRVLYESAQEVFEAIGKLRYFTEETLHQTPIPDHVKKYRFATTDSKGKTKIRITEHKTK